MNWHSFVPVDLLRVIIHVLIKRTDNAQTNARIRFMIGFSDKQTICV